MAGTDRHTWKRICHENRALLHFIYYPWMKEYLLWLFIIVTFLFLTCACVFSDIGMDLSLLLPIFIVYTLIYLGSLHKIHKVIKYLRNMILGFFANGVLTDMSEDFQLAGKEIDGTEYRNVRLGKKYLFLRNTSRSMLFSNRVIAFRDIRSIHIKDTPVTRTPGSVYLAIHFQQDGKEQIYGLNIGSVHSRWHSVSEIAEITEEWDPFLRTLLAINRDIEFHPYGE